MSGVAGLKSDQSDQKRNLSPLISHGAHRVLREQSKKLCVLSELCEIFKCSFPRVKTHQAPILPIC